MKALKFWITGLVFEGIFAAGLYAWLGMGLEPVGRVVVFWLWFFAVLFTFVGLAGDKTWFSAPTPPGFIAYKWFVRCVFVTALVSVGYIWLPIIMLVSSLLVRGARYREPKEVPVCE